MEFLLAFIGVSFDVISMAHGGWNLGKPVCIVAGMLTTTSGKLQYDIILIAVVAKHFQNFYVFDIFYHGVFYFVGFVSMLTLCALSISRMGSFVPICGLDGKISSFSTCRKIITAIWLYSLVLSLPPVFGWGSYVPELSGLG